MNTKEHLEELSAMAREAGDTAIEIFILFEDIAPEYSALRKTMESLAKSVTHGIDATGGLGECLASLRAKEAEAQEAVERLHHQNEILSLEKDEARIKAKRLAAMLSYTERRNKRLREMNNG